MKKVFIVLIVIGVLVGPLAAQETVSTSRPATTQIPTEKLKVRVDLVNVLMTVTNKKNHFVIDLAKDDFRLFEDNKPQTIRYFSRETSLPLCVRVLVDTSNSIRDACILQTSAKWKFQIMSWR